MEFIEKLSQEVELKEKQKTAREAHRKQRKDQAVAFHTQSGIGDLVQRLAELLKRDSRLSLISRRVPFSPEYWKNILPPLQLDTMDVDSIFDRMVFDGSREQEEISVRGIPVTLYYDDRYYDVQRHKGILVETRPDGTIVFHGTKQASIPIQEWGENQEVLEATLETTFNNPYIMEVKYFRRAEPGKWPKL